MFRQSLGQLPCYSKEHIHCAPVGVWRADMAYRMGSTVLLAAVES